MRFGGRLRDRAPFHAGSASGALDYAHRMATDRGARDPDTALRHSQRMLEATRDNSEAVIYAKDAAGRYLFVNRRFEELFRVDPGGMLGKTDYDLFSPEEAETYRDMDRRVAASNGPLSGEETVR